MRKGISFLLCLLAPVALRGQETASEVGELLEQLSSEMYRARTEATDGLIALGEAAEGAVEARLRQSEDPETKTRCTYILRMVRASRVRRALLPPLPEVSLDFDGLPFPDALSRLEAAGGFPFDHENLPTAATTIHCKAVTPFEALDALCRSVGASWRIHMGFFSPEAGDPTKLQVERPFEGSIENEACAPGRSRSSAPTRLSTRRGGICSRAAAATLWVVPAPGARIPRPPGSG
ncbi:MAG: hypothetical protein HYY93_00795 [Planctomycetes bacterium]|nr:hypothetical protein [Planctomycetota bacterium]